MPAKLVGAAVILCIASLVASQRTGAVCLPTFSWMNNAFDQSPCLLTAFLDSTCSTDPTNTSIPKLQPNTSYPIPALSNTGITPCRCTTVYYAVMQACAACQGVAGQPAPWSVWTTGCKDLTIGQWPREVPRGTSIPAWAYLDVVTPNTFDVATASALADEHLPDSTTAASPTSTTASSPATSALKTSVTPAAGTSDPSGTSTSAESGAQEKKINVGAIVGGVIGGIALIAGVVVGVVFFLRARARGSRDGSDGISGLPTYTDVYSGDDKRSATMQGSSDHITRPFDGFSRVLYDPENPATFPGSVHGPGREVSYPGTAEI